MLSISAFLVGAYWYSTFGTFSPVSAQFYTHHEKHFSHLLIARLMMYWLLVPAIMAGWGAIVLDSRQRSLTVFVSVTTLGVIFTLHVIMQAHVSAAKHLVLGLYFLYPLVGVAIERIEQRFGRTFSLAALGVMAIAGVMHWFELEHNWPDPTPVSEFLAQHWSEGDAALAEEVWSYRLGLYWGGTIDSPFAIYDAWNIDNGQRDWCSVRWLVGRESVWGTDRVTDIARRCGHRPVFSHRDSVYWMRSNGDLAKLLLSQTVYERVEQK